VYKIENKINKKCYIGKTVYNIEKRWRQHVSEYNSKRNKNRPLYSAFNKYGLKQFGIEILEECSEDKVNEKEIFWINKIGTFKNGYNATLGGDGKILINRDLVVNLYNKHKNCSKVARILNIDLGSVCNILKNKNVKVLTASESNKKSNGKSVNMYDKEMNLLKNFSSLGDASRYISDNKFSKSKKISNVSAKISLCARGKRKTAFNYIWKWDLA